eukprot:419379-Rhodomonas_salina.1
MHQQHCNKHERRETVNADRPAPRSRRRRGSWLKPAETTSKYHTYRSASIAHKDRPSIAHVHVRTPMVSERLLVRTRHMATNILCDTLAQTSHLHLASPAPNVSFLEQGLHLSTKNQVSEPPKSELGQR